MRPSLHMFGYSLYAISDKEEYNIFLNSLSYVRLHSFQSNLTTFLSEDLLDGLYSSIKSNLLFGLITLSYFISLITHRIFPVLASLRISSTNSNLIGNLPTLFISSFSNSFNTSVLKFSFLTSFTIIDLSKHW